MPSSCAPRLCRRGAERLFNHEMNTLSLWGRHDSVRPVPSTPGGPLAPRAEKARPRGVSPPLGGRSGLGRAFPSPGGGPGGAGEERAARGVVWAGGGGPPAPPPCEAPAAAIPAAPAVSGGGREATYRQVDRRARAVAARLRAL